MPRTIRGQSIAKGALHFTRFDVWTSDSPLICDKPFSRSASAIAAVRASLVFTSEAALSRYPFVEANCEWHTLGPLMLDVCLSVLESESIVTSEHFRNKISKLCLLPDLLCCLWNSFFIAILFDGCRYRTHLMHRWRALQRNGFGFLLTLFNSSTSIYRI